MKLIALVGFIGVGKDTVGQILKDSYGFEIRKFAKGIKDISIEYLKFDPNFLEDRKFKDTRITKYNNKTPREIWQFIGTELGRSIYKDIWVDYLCDRLQSTDKVVVTDVRFLNEIIALKRRGALIVWIDAINRLDRIDPYPELVYLVYKHLGVNKLTRAFISLINKNCGHQSEAEMFKLVLNHFYLIDAVIENYWGVEVLEKEIEIVLSPLL